MTKPRLGRIGVWSNELRSDDPARLEEIRAAAAELEELGYGTLWAGGSPDVSQARRLLEATRRVSVGTSIISVWQHPAAEITAAYAKLAPAARERFVVGLGVSHPHMVEGYARPYSAMKAYLEELDAAPDGPHAGRRMLAALGPRMLGLARDRASGAVPYLVTAEHTARARETLGEGPLLAPELKVVLDDDLASARRSARDYLAFYLPMPNYTNNLLRLGFTERDFEGDGSDRLLDAVFALGDASAVQARVDAFLAAGADHVAVQVVLDPARRKAGELPLAEWRELAVALPLAG
ncbi:LLM class F420-dependent oxidoreductase [Streptomyces sp. NPDC020667]|uniref:LLM class F420-dependent oxidoreductase n=1 Tax=Streptomyces sp. NPDC020667 TaxID=3154895 RepID=UPI0033E87394